MNWYIGQRIVAVRNHSQGCFKKGDEFTIKGITVSPCIHKHTLLDVGDIQPVGRVICIRCKTTVNLPAGWYNEICFAPLETRPELSETTVNELGEIETKELQTA